MILILIEVHCSGRICSFPKMGCTLSIRGECGCVGRDWSKLKSLIVRRRLEGQSVAEICVQAQVSRKVFYYWWNRCRAEGWRGLEEKPRGRPVGPDVDDSEKERIIKLRKRYCWGPSKMAGHLNRKGSSINHNRVHRIICEAGLNHPSARSKEKTVTVLGRRILSFAAAITG